MMHALDEVGRISDVEVVGRLERLVRADRALSAKLLLHLGEVDARELYRGRSFSSMFEYCRSGMGMSDGEAYLRILAARVGRKFPLVLERLGAGSVHLTAIKLLAPHFTEENHAHLLDRARGMTKRKVEVLVAELAPRPDVPARMRKLHERRARCEANRAATSGCSTADVSPADACSSVAAQAASASSSELVLQPTGAMAETQASSSTFALEPLRARAKVTPLSPDRFELKLTLGREAHDALEQLVELLRHQNPSGDVKCIVERALCELLKREMKRRFGHADAAETRRTREPAAKPRSDTKAESPVVDASKGLTLEAKAESQNVKAKAKRDKASSKSRYIPRKILREVHARDNGQCTFVSRDGLRCTERGFLEVHHHNITFARGGEATAANLRIMCRVHNMYLAQQDYGRGFMQNKLHEAAARKQPSLVPGQGKH